MHQGAEPSFSAKGLHHEIHHWIAQTEALTLPDKNIASVTTKKPNPLLI